MVDNRTATTDVGFKIAREVSSLRARLACPDAFAVLPAAVAMWIVGSETFSLFALAVIGAHRCCRAIWVNATGGQSIFVSRLLASFARNADVIVCCGLAPNKTLDAFVAPRNDAIQLFPGVLLRTKSRCTGDAHVVIVAGFPPYISRLALTNSELTGLRKGGCCVTPEEHCIQ